MEEIIMKVINALMDLSMQYPLITTIFAILYSAGLIFKAAQEFIHAVVGATQTKKDDEALEKVEASKIYKYVKIFFDYALRLKLK